MFCADTNKSKRHKLKSILFDLFQFRYKRRVYTQTYLDEKQLSKLHTKVRLNKSFCWWNWYSGIMENEGLKTLLLSFITCWDNLLTRWRAIHLWSPFDVYVHSGTFFCSRMSFLTTYVTKYITQALGLK